MSWQLLILLQTFLTANSIILLRILARKKKTAKASFLINAVLYIGLYLTMLAMLPSLKEHVSSHELTKYWWRFIGGGLAFALTNVCTYMTLVYFDAALSSIVGSLNAVFTIIGAAIVLGEKLTITQGIGAIILTAGISYGIIATQDTRKRHVRRSVKLGLMFGILAGIFYALAIVNEKSLLEQMDASSYVVYGVGGQFVMSALTALILQPRQLYILGSLRVVKWAILSGILRGAAGVCFILSEVRSNNVALVTVISNFKIIFVILLGWLLLKERKNLTRKLASATTAILGLAVMFWQ